MKLSKVITGEATWRLVLLAHVDQDLDEHFRVDFPHRAQVLDDVVDVARAALRVLEQPEKVCDVADLVLLQNLLRRRVLLLGRV